MPKIRNGNSNVSGASAKPFSEFLNPNSMITPGAAGAFTMVITNTLCQQFAELPLNFTGLAVSFLFGAVVFGYGASLPARAMYYAINSLIIFVVAVGSNAVGTGIDKRINQETNLAALDSTATRPGTFALASADSKDSRQRTQQQEQSSGQEPPKKPKFFRQWF
jgi:hypothetical protein